ncbi:probable mediator of RNA polymerase II transcription subunit 26c [Andrographis paniculata]|uniref:probable mediator of RNA polymerase II transcription subunit 26c n=1 Tax=Andrographis paniculata TaxID=175694 RepID=UPI0021E8577D|nr:probable mediator of RNA polymerase II transcription subunit 26c [Andrographis paniculata]
MDSDEFRAVLSRSRVGIWEMIEAAIRVAGSDHGEELRRRRDGIVESLYATAGRRCPNCSGDVEEGHRSEARNDTAGNSDGLDDRDDRENDKVCIDEDDDEDDDEKSNRNLIEDFGKSPDHRNLSEEGDDLDPFGGLFDDEQTTIISIKEQLEDPHQSDESIVELLQTLSDMDITFQALKETDIGRYVNQLRKHSSNEVRRLVKHLVRKWKETVGEWVSVNEPHGSSNLLADADSPQPSIPRNRQNGHHQVPDFGYSPNPRNGNSSAERNYVEHEPKPKPSQSAPRREPPSRPPQPVPKPTSTPPNKMQGGSVIDDERLNSARKRLQENYQEAQNAKKQRTIQVMDIHDIPKPKKAFFAKNKGGFQGKFNR